MDKRSSYGGTLRMAEAREKIVVPTYPNKIVCSHGTHVPGTCPDTAEALLMGIHGYVVPESIMFFGGEGGGADEGIATFAFWVCLTVPILLVYDNHCFSYIRAGLNKNRYSIR